jgi:hypothetical protein
MQKPRTAPFFSFDSFADDDTRDAIIARLAKPPGIAPNR